MSRVVDHLEDRGLRFEVIPHEEAWTSIDEARELGVSADEVVKTVLLDTEAGHVLAVIPGSRRLDMKRVREVLGDGHARLATEEELERDYPGYELGALPPLDELLGTPMYVDPEVFDHRTIAFAAGKQTESVRIRTGELFGEGVKVAHLTDSELATEIC